MPTVDKKGPVVVPYMLRDGVPTFRDSEIMALYERMADEGSAPFVFYDGSVKDPAGFLEMMKRPDVSLYVVFDDEPDGGVAGCFPVAIFWLTDMRQKAAECHFTGFSGVRGRAAEVALGAMSQIMFIEDPAGGYVLNVVYGVVPEWNRPVVRMLEKMGMEDVGIMPYRTWCASDGKSYPAVIMCLTRDTIVKRGMADADL